MPLAICYWILMLLALVFCLWRRPSEWPLCVLLFLLALVIGWAVFGSPIKT